jgi:hypothetical protein
MGRRSSGRSRAAAVAVVMSVGATALVSCRPCDLVVACRQAPVAAVVGQVLDRQTGRPVPEAGVTARFVGGTLGRPLVIQTQTQPDGSFEISAPVDSVGMSVLEITVAAPDKPVFVVPNVGVPGQLTAGDGVVLVPWASEPEIPYALSIRRATAGSVAAAQVVYVRTGGRRLLVSGQVTDSVAGVTGGDGIIFLFAGASTDTIGDVMGSLIVREAGRPPDTVSNVAVASTPRFRPTHTLIGVVIP